MPQPSEVLYLNRELSPLILERLEILVNGVLTHLINHRVSADMLFPQLCALYQPNEFNPGFADATLRLRNRLRSALTGTRTALRLKYNDVVLLQFCLRLSRNRENRPGYLAFEKRLEAVRKRLKRAIISQYGVSEYNVIEARWTRHRNWLRLNVLLPLPPKRKVTERAYARELRQQLKAMAREVIAETCDTPVPEKALAHAAKLAARHLRRGRYEASSRSLLGDQQKAREFIFQFLTERDLLNLRFEYRSLCEQMSARADKFRAVMTVEPVIHNWNPVIVENTAVGQADPVLEDVPSLPLRNDYDLRKEYCAWLVSEVEHSYWKAVEKESEFQLTFLGAVAHARSATLAEIIEQSRPEFAKCHDDNELVSLYAAWGLKWLLAFTRVRRELRSILADGHRMARGRRAQMSASEQVARAREIQERCNFPDPVVDPFDTLVQFLRPPGCRG